MEQSTASTRPSVSVRAEPDEEQGDSAAPHHNNRFSVDNPLTGLSGGGGAPSPRNTGKVKRKLSISAPKTIALSEDMYTWWMLSTRMPDQSWSEAALVSAFMFLSLVLQVRPSTRTVCFITQH